MGDGRRQSCKIIWMGEVDKQLMLGNRYSLACSFGVEAQYRSLVSVQHSTHIILNNLSQTYLRTLCGNSQLTTDVSP